MDDSYKTVTLVLQANCMRLKTLFRKKEDIEAILKQSGIQENCGSEAFYHACHFFNAHAQKYIPNKEKYSKKPIHEDPINDPVIKIGMIFPKERFRFVNECLDYMNKYVDNGIAVDKDIPFQVVDILFDYVHGRRVQFCSFFNISYKAQMVMLFFLTFI